MPFALNTHRPDLEQNLLDTFPTGSLVVRGLKNRSSTLRQKYAHIVAEYFSGERFAMAPEFVLGRIEATQPETLLSELNREAWKW